MKAIIIVLCLALTGQAMAQNIDDAGYILEYVITEEGDTVFIDNIEPAFVYPKGTRISRDMRQYYKLVYNFNKVYPYVHVARVIVDRADSALTNVTKAEKEKYVNSVQKQLLKDFSPVVHGMTISQGKFLVRLVNRELGRTSYQLVKDYKNGFAAGFWQGVGWLFGQNLKAEYEPEGKDKMTEELVKKWEDGSFDQLYFSIFYEFPPKTPIPLKYK